MLACALLYGPERIPLDAGLQWEIRVRLCTPLWSLPSVVVEERTYERTQVKDGTYRYRHPNARAEEALKPSEDWWKETKRVQLFTTTTAPPGDAMPEGY